jgi:putative heme-binding domain-containing protein
VADASARAALYEKIAPLLKGLPKSLAGGEKPTAPLGRYVRIELPRSGTLTLAEVEVTSGSRNVAPQGKASQKNTANGGEARLAIDGNTSGHFSDGGQTHSEENTSKPWWELDLGAALPIESIVVYNRTDGYLGKRLEGFTLDVLDAERKSVFKREKIEAPRDKVALNVGQPDPAVAIRQAAMVALTYVRGQEAKTFESLARFLDDEQNRAAAIRAIKRIARTDWPKDQARALFERVVAWVRTVPAHQRTAPEALDALEFADALAGLLPPDEARRARAELGELGVRVVRVGTLFERMSYDVDTIAVRAGKPVEFVFENSDLMPHNFVILESGSLERIGMMAEETAQQPGAAERHYVPASKNVLLASTLLQPRAAEKLSFVAPTAPGVYPYVCTYPGHWRRMYGALYVVDDLDGYLENPESYLAAHPLEIKDDLLKDRRPRTEWKLEDLAAAVGQLANGRSYGNGKQIFQVANCVACHKMDGVGTAIGPELTKLDEKMQALDVLKELLDPSARINEKFQNYVFELQSGKVVTGLVLEETPERIRVIENPLAKADALELKPADIAERHKSASSLMPKGLLDKLSREEILDLIAYVLARGDQQAALFKGGHDHAGH